MYFSRAMELLDRDVNAQTKYNILDFNACCKGGARDKAAKKLGNEIAALSLAEKVKALWSLPNMGKPVLSDDGLTIITGINYCVDGVYKCACPNFYNLRNASRVSLTYCHCCAGHFRYHYQKALSVKLRTKEIVSSPLNSGGEKPCVIVYECKE